MKIRPASNLACPLDGLPLQIEQKHCRCANGHTFDIAKQGYINLLPAQQKRSRDPGDSKDMIQARQTFLDNGLFEKIAKQLDEIANLHLATKDNACILDAGCGEGYFLSHLAVSLLSDSPEQSLSLIGVDISKWAVIAATKRNREITWLVASNKNLPVLPGSIDLILCTFGFPVYEEFKKRLKPGGKILLADPGPEHLIELRELIYPEVRKSVPPTLSSAEAYGYRLKKTKTLTYKTGSISQEQIQNLLTMTPHLYRAPYEGKEAAKRLEQIDLTVDIVFRVLELKD